MPFTVSTSPDSRCTKEILAMVFALSIGLLAVFYGQIKPFKNKWFLLIPIYLLFNLSMAPHFDLFINNVESGNFYFWKPFAQVICFLLMIIAISSSEINIEKILNVMVICGTVMAGYVVMQKLGLDQFWVARQGQQFEGVHGRVLGGNLGQPTLVASWMVMMVPIAFHLKRFWMAWLIVAACLLTQGAMVIISLLSILTIAIFYFNPQLRKSIVGIFAILLISVSALLYFNSSFRSKIDERMDGRSTVWTNIIKDIRHGQIDGLHKYPITGVGLGRFAFIFPDKNKSPFHEAHNDTLEFIYDCGIAGAFLLFAGLLFMARNIPVNGLSFSVGLSFIAIFICSLGCFPFQLGAHQFYASVLVGLLHNDLIKQGVV